MLNISALTKNPIGTLSTTAAAGVGGALSYLAEAFLNDPYKEVALMLIPTISICLQFGFSMGLE
jgi:hypothetical protein